MDFRNKRILFFSVRTFGLEQKITDKLLELGASVHFFDERPSNSIWTKGLIRIRKDLLKKRIEKYYNKILIEIEDEKFDFLFVNRGEVIPKVFLKRFIEQNPKTKRIFYTWDSIKNNPNPKKIIHLFHEIFTFDPKDSLNYGLKLRPLFFVDSFQDVYNQKTSKMYDIIFLGTAHSDRYILTNKIMSMCEEMNLKTYSFFYSQGRIVYFFKKYFDKSFKEFEYKKLSFKSLSFEQITNLYKQTNVILDINHPNQTGLTMRTFEAIGSGLKLITTNPEVRKYSFFKESNILVVDRESVNLDFDFFKTPYEDLGIEMYQSLSLEGWLREIFSSSDSKGINWYSVPKDD